jgi:4-methyl-5(b-hydroxyethyl)-thiazole monophosphate biosynthesis
MIVIPGGMGGVGNLRKDKRVLEIINKIFNHGIVAAICAGPLVLQDAGILNGKKIACHPAVEKQINNCEILNYRVVIDGNIITSQGPGTTFDFALSIIALIEGDEKADSLAEPMIVKREKAFVVKSEE